MYYSKRAGNWSFWTGILMIITALGSGLYWLVLLSLVPLVYSYKEYKLSGSHEEWAKKAQDSKIDWDDWNNDLILNPEYSGVIGNICHEDEPPIDES